MIILYTRLRSHAMGNRMIRTAARISIGSLSEKINPGGLNAKKLKQKNDRSVYYVQSVR